MAALGVLLLVATIATGVGLMGTSAWLISRAAQHPSIAMLSLAIVGVRFFGLSRGILRYLERLVSHDVTLRLLARLRARVFRALVPLAPARLIGHRGGDLLERIVDDVGTLENLYVRVLGPTVAAGLLVVLTAVVLVPFGVPLAGAAVAGLVVGGVAAPVLAAWLSEEPGRRAIALRGDLAAEAADGVQGCADLLAFGREAEHAAKVDAGTRAFVAEQARLARASALGGSLSTFAADVTVVGMLALAIPRVRAGDLDGVNLAVVALVALAAFEAVSTLPAAWQELGSVRSAGRRLFEVLDAAPAVGEPAPESRAAVGPPRPPGGAAVGPPPLLEVRDLSFIYPGALSPTLAEIDLRVTAGRRVAVVGASGSGKSTLAHLLLRFWDVAPGRIFLDGHDVTTMPGDAARERFAFSGQRTHLFTGTLRENLTLGRPGASEAEIGAALRSSRLEGFVDRLPEGLDTWVGEQGLQLSGGERQRLALARALLRPAPILLLDEPTAHLDALTEEEVLAEIVRAGAGRGTIVITHRLVGLEAFDEVVVLARGRVVERGTAAELQARGGAFAHMLGLQRDEAVVTDAAPLDEVPVEGSRRAQARESER